MTSFDPLATIAAHSQALYDAAEVAGLGAPVEHCPGWTVADLLAHVRQVHWFWATVVEGLLPAPPEERPERAPAAELVITGRAEAGRLFVVLTAAEPGARCWTWAPQQDVAFVLRHQVQEAAVHHFDAAHAAGLAWTMEDAAAEDAVSEFLTFSVSTEADPIDPPAPALEGELRLRAAGSGTTWTVRDGGAAGTLAFDVGPTTGPAVEAAAPDLLLWLYRRRELDTSAVSREVLSRFDPLRFTD
jgi:uncharacterized protein (TIGR03083 family)